MNYTPKVIVIDYETALWDGSPSVEFYRHDFEVVSCAFAWKNEKGTLQTRCTWGEDETRKMLQKIQDDKIPIVVHNLQFEWGVTKCRFPDLDLPFHADTMRLSQLTDNGGKEFVKETEKEFADILSELEGKKPTSGLSLESCNSRLGDKKYHKHKAPYKQLMVDRGGTKSSFDLLTKEELTAYNTLDAEVTLDLYEKTTEILKSRGISWDKDNILYFSRCKLTAEAKIEGVLIDQVQLDKYIVQKRVELLEIEETFWSRFSAQIAEIEAEMVVNTLKQYKSERGRETAVKKLELNPPKFNLASPKQKIYLFTKKLGHKARFFTKSDKPQPTMGRKLLWQFGEDGECLIKLGGARIGLQQAENLKKLSSYDGKYHIDIKCCAAVTGRLGGGSNA